MARTQSRRTVDSSQRTDPALIEAALRAAGLRVKCVPEEAVLTAVRATPGITVPALATELGISRSTVDIAARKLEEAGHIASGYRGRLKGFVAIGGKK